MNRIVQRHGRTPDSDGPHLGPHWHVSRAELGQHNDHLVLWIWSWKLKGADACPNLPTVGKAEQDRIADAKALIPNRAETRNKDKSAIADRKPVCDRE